MFSISKNLNYVFGKYIPVSKVAFLINEEYIFDHYHNVMLEMKNDEFDIILDNKFKSVTYTDVVDGLKNNGWSVKFLDEVVFVNKYKCLVTHLYLGGETTEHGTLFSRFGILILQFLI